MDAEVYAKDAKESGGGMCLAFAGVARSIWVADVISYRVL
jgi:hypothetical protein